MKKAKHSVAAVAGLIFAIATTAANAASHPARTGTGGGPETTITAPHTAPTGRVMPRPRSVGPQPRSDAPQKLEPEFRDSLLTKDICVGC